MMHWNRQMAEMDEKEDLRAKIKQLEAENQALRKSIEAHTKTLDYIADDKCDNCKHKINGTYQEFFGCPSVAKQPL